MSKTTREDKPPSEWWQCRACRYQRSWDEPLEHTALHHTCYTSYIVYECPNCSAVFADKLSFSLTGPPSVRFPDEQHPCSVDDPQPDAVV